MLKKTNSGQSSKSGEKTALHILYAVLIAEILLGFWMLVLDPWLGYRKAVSLMENGQYQEAAYAFADLPLDYRDSISKYGECKERIHGENWYLEEAKDHKKDKKPSLPANPAPARPSHRHSPSDEESEYDVSRFSNEEDFYDFYYDDFADFEDAENYYRHHTD